MIKSIVAFVAFGMLPVVAAHAASLQPFNANYAMQRNGDTIGEATFSLRQLPDGWEYDQSTRGTHGIAALAAANVDERSIFDDAGGVLQLRSYHYHLSTLVKSTTRSIEVDPATRSILIRDKKHQLRFPMQAGVLDPNTVTLAIAQDLARGKRGTLVYPVATRSAVEMQRFVVGKEQTVQVPAGSIRTIVVTRQRDTPNGRITAYWFGLDNGLIPARIVQNEPNGESWVANLESLSR